MAPNEHSEWSECKDDSCACEHPAVSSDLTAHQHRPVATSAVLQKLTTSQLEVSLLRGGPPSALVRGYHECYCCSHIEPTWSRLAMFFRKLKQALSESLYSRGGGESSAVVVAPVAAAAGENSCCFNSGHLQYPLYSGGAGWESTRGIIIIAL